MTLLYSSHEATRQLIVEAWIPRGKNNIYHISLPFSQLKPDQEDSKGGSLANAAFAELSSVYGVFQPRGH